MGMISCFRGRFKVTSPRGWRVISGKQEYHGGLDLVALENKTVYAIADGTVAATPYEQDGFGWYVRQLLPDGRRIYYGHLAKGSIAVTPGQKINKGDKLGTMGSTGRSTGAHTHLELRVPGTSKESLDISAFTGIPNKIGTYEAEAKKVLFDDTVGHWAKDDIDDLVKMGIVNGTGDRKFEPEKKITRAEAAALIRRAIRYITGV